MTIRNWLFPLPFMFLWVILTNQVGIVSFMIGYALAFLLGLLLMGSRERQQSVQLSRIPDVFAIIIYIVTLSVDILLSGIDVALRVLGLRSVARTGIIAVPINDEKKRDVIAGLSAHAITITPGELVVAYDKDEEVMYVHALDVDASEPHLERKQTDRVAKYRRMLGDD